VRWTLVALVPALVLVVGCGPEQVDSSHDDRCLSHYDPVADAPTRAALKRKLLHEVDTRVRSLRLIEQRPDHDKTTVNLLNRRHLIVVSLDMWQRGNGTWTAQQWAQCTD
jgi:hypothetical protein